MKKNILIIGSKGYLGTKISEYLAKFGYDITGIDMGFFSDGYLNTPFETKMLSGDARTIKEADLIGFDVVLQLAGISNDPFGNLSPSLIYDPTRIYAVKIANFCKKLGIKYIFPSSCSLYGLGSNEYLSEDGIISPQTPYSINKIQIENDLSLIADQNFSPIALRLATVFGYSSRIRFDVVVNMLCGMALTEKRIVLNSNGEAWRPHIYIDDVCEAFRCCIEWDYNDGKLMILNVGRNDNNLKINQIAELIQFYLPNCKIEYLQNLNQNTNELILDKKINDGVDKRNYKVNFDKIHNILPGFNSKWTVEKGIEKLLSDLKSNGLTNSQFKSREFYRLQQIEFLYNSKKINKTLEWN
jgi:nucleoside-diphosphate-sugar epimerase